MTPLQKRAGSLTIAAASLVAFVANWEGESLPVYKDMVGIPTVCNGHTGPDVKVGDVWSKERCDAILVKDVTKHGEGVLACTPVEINQNEYDAYTSLAFNNGVAAYCNSSIPKKLARGDRKAACDTVLEFNKIRDKSKPKVLNKKTGKMEYPLVPVRGLTKRRQAEWRLCITPITPVQPSTPMQKEMA